MSSVIPWHLWIVRAHASFRGICGAKAAVEQMAAADLLASKELRGIRAGCECTRRGGRFRASRGCRGGRGPNLLPGALPKVAHLDGKLAWYNHFGAAIRELDLQSIPSKSSIHGRLVHGAGRLWPSATYLGQKFSFETPEHGLLFLGETSQHLSIISTAISQSTDLREAFAALGSPTILRGGTSRAMYLLTFWASSTLTKASTTPRDPLTSMRLAPPAPCSSRFLRSITWAPTFSATLLCARQSRKKSLCCNAALFRS